MPTHVAGGREHGFSLIELMEAIVITLIVIGAIYGLLAQGQNAFRREPEISDRQQQIRIAMDLIQRDIVTAGMSLPGFVQAFTPGLEADGPDNAQGVPTDFLELVGYDGACMPLPLCTGGGPTDVTVAPSTCYRFPCAGVDCPLVAVRPGLVAGSASSIHVATGVAAIAGCPIPLSLSIAVDPVAVRSIPLPQVVQGNSDIKPVQIVRYEIAVDAAGIPSLWRSARGGLDAALAYVPAPGAGSDWQLVATGIEDLQIEYRTGENLPLPPAWQTGDELTAIPDPQEPAPYDYQLLVREVKVTLTARTTGQATLHGESMSVAGVRAIRGSLTSVTAPRAALFALSVGPQAPDPQAWQ